MAQQNLCRLCVQICHDGTSFCEENGEVNELYYIIKKFFHPQIVDLDEANYLSIVCSACLNYIKQFEDYVNSLQKAQEKLRIMIDQDLVAAKDCHQTNISKGSLLVKKFTPKFGNWEILNIYFNDLSHEIPKGSFLVDYNEEGQILNIQEPEEDLPKTSSEWHTEESDQYTQMISLEDNSSNTLAIMPEMVVDSQIEGHDDDDVVDNPSSARTIALEKPIELNVTNYTWNKFTLADQNTPRIRNEDKSSNTLAKMQELVVYRPVEAEDNADDPSSARTIVLEKPIELNVTNHFWKKFPLADLYTPIIRNEDNSSNTLSTMPEPIVDSPKEEDDDGVDDPSSSRTIVLEKPIELNVTNHFWKKFTLNMLLAQWMPNIHCSECPMTFSTWNALEDHFGMEHPTAILQVHCCSQTFNTRTQLKNHLVLHCDPQAYICKICGKNLEGPTMLRRHENQEHGGYQSAPPCPHCAKICQSAKCRCSNLCSEHSEKRQFSCSRCGIEHVTRHSLLQHMANVHFKRTIYSCAFCSMTYRNFFSLVNHRNEKHPEEIDNEKFYIKISNDIEDPETPKKNLVKREKSIYKKKHPKVIDNENFSIKVNNDIEDPKTPNKDMLKREKSVYECITCLKIFRKISSVIRHNKIVHEHPKITRACYRRVLVKPTNQKVHKIEWRKNSPEKDYDHVEDDAAEDDKYSDKCFKDNQTNPLINSKCSHCNENFISYPELAQHINEVHGDIAKFTCEHCGHSADSSLSLSRHLLYCFKNYSKPTCSLCNQTFKYIRTLREHMAINHNGQDLYICAYCPQTFKRLSNVREHRRIMHPSTTGIDYYRDIP